MTVSLRDESNRSPQANTGMIHYLVIHYINAFSMWLIRTLPCGPSGA